MVSRASGFDSENKTEGKSLGDRYDYIKKEGVGGGKMDFSCSQIPLVYPEASNNPLDKPSNMLFLVDVTAHNHMNFGNFLFGATGQALGFSKTELTAGAHWNSLSNPTSNGYKRQFDSSDDQFSITRGYGYGIRNNFQRKRWSVGIGN